MKHLILALLLFASLPPQAPRDTPPPAVENARRERELRAAIASGSATSETYTELAALMNREGRFDEVIKALKGAAALEPTHAEPQHRLATYFWDKSRSDPALSPDQRRAYIQQGLDAEDRALALRPDYPEAMTYKNILLRLKANLSADPSEQKRLIDEADALRERVIAMQRDRQTTTQPPADPAALKPFSGFPEPFEATMSRLQPVRVGGNVRAPAKITDARPVYPAIAQAARVQGVVILEIVVDDTGAVVNARVLRSIPLLDAAALDSVSRWQFSPSELNGRAVPVIMTVTVNFTMME